MKSLVVRDCCESGNRTAVKETMENQLERLYAIDLLGILVHKYQDGQLEGEIIHQYKEESTPFFGVLDLIKKMEFQYDEWDYPQTSTRDRSFRKREKYTYPNRKGKKRLPDEAGTLEKFPIIQKRGKASTFFIHTKYRQNATWQGDIFRVEEEACFPFKSVLRMLQIMDREMRKDQGEDA